MRERQCRKTSCPNLFCVSRDTFFAFDAAHPRATSPRPVALTGTPITALASASNRRFQVQLPFPD
jgi:hypothetical protein